MMKSHLADEQLAQLSDHVAATMGLYFPIGRRRDLERNLKLASTEFGYKDFDLFLKWLLSEPLTQEQVESLASFLTISETYFWREPRVFEALRDQILPELTQAKATTGRNLRLWSAGCATGEEPYSIAIALREALPDLKDWRITLLATDINPHILRQAAAGVYGNWSFRNSAEGFKEKYFNRTLGGKYEIHPEIRKMVTFEYLNLAADVFPTPMNNTNAMDIIFCRNVLMYFTPERARLVGQGLYDCLVEGGWFIVSSSELSQHTFSQFTSVNFSGGITYRKQPSIQQPVIARQIERPASVQPVLTRSPAVITRTRQSGKFKSIEPLKPVAKEGQPEDALRVIRTLADQGKLIEAWAACETAIAVDRLNPTPLYLGATILQELNRENEAEKLLKRILYLDPAYLLAHFTLGNLAQRAGNAAAAKRSFENAQELLDHYAADEILPDTEGLTAGRLREIVRATFQTGVLPG